MPSDSSGSKPEETQQEQDQQQERPESNNADELSPSDLASRLKSLETQLAMQPEIDEDRVRRLREALHRGEFKVDAERVAHKLVDFEKHSK